MDECVSTYLQKHDVSREALRALDRVQRSFIDGRLVAGDRPVHDLIEPSTAGRLAQCAAAAADEVVAAVGAARREVDGGTWSRLRPIDRERAIHRFCDLLESHAQELAELESVNVGKSLALAREVEVAGSIEVLRYFAGWASKLEGRLVNPATLTGKRTAFTRKEPVGVVACIIPWNFPINTLCWKLGAALASGCTVVVKPSELTPVTALRMAELATESGLPDGVINVVTGGPEVGRMLVEHRGIDKITFTGSTRGGRLVAHAAAESIRPITLELGGKSPALVLHDVDVPAAARAVADGLFYNSGQCCDAGSRAFVDRRIHDVFLAELIDVVRAMGVAPGLDPACFMGPLVSARQCDSVMGYIESGIAEGARLVSGGRRKQGSGFFVEPTIFADCSPHLKIMREEIFGPVLSVASFDSLDEAVTLANDTDYGLAAAVYSNDLSAVHSLIPRLKAGIVYVNQHAALDPALPFGGRGASGFGKDLGPEQIEGFLRTQAVVITAQ